MPRQHTGETEQQAQQYVEAAGQVPALFKQLHSLQGEGGKGGEAAAHAGFPKQEAPIRQAAAGEQAGEKPDNHRARRVDQQGEKGKIGFDGKKADGIAAGGPQRTAGRDNEQIDHGLLHSRRSAA